MEARFPDPSDANPYLAFSALMMAGLDGVENKIHPGEAATKDLYHLPPEEDKLVPTVCHSLDMALEHLDKDRAFLTKGGVFTDSMLDAYIELKMGEVNRGFIAVAPHPSTTCTTACDAVPGTRRACNTRAAGNCGPDAKGTASAVPFAWCAAYSPPPGQGWALLRGFSVILKIDEHAPRAHGEFALFRP